jgi:hypothetical protein
MGKKIPLYLGEFNSGYMKGNTLSESQIFEYIKRSKRFGTCGWAIWRWSYLQDQTIPAFNFAEIANDEIKPGVLFNYLVKALKKA